MDNSHVVQVESAPKSADNAISISMSSNHPQFEWIVTPESPIIMYTSVTLSGVPVVNANVRADITGITRSGMRIPQSSVILVDSGTGDPDIRQHDGIYSKFVTNIHEIGRYQVTLHVSSDKKNPARLATSDGKTMGDFTRIVRGFSFHVASIQRGSNDSYPPARIMDLTARVTDNQQIVFRWTAPGDDFDEGRPSSYHILYSEDPFSFYRAGSSSPRLVERFTGTLYAGGLESHTINIVEYDRNLYYTILAVDDQGNTGALSNIAHVFVPQPLISRETGLMPQRSNNQLREGLFNPFEVIKEPNEIILYVVMAIVAIVVITFLLVMLIMLVSHKLTRHPAQLNHSLASSPGSNLDIRDYSLRYS